NLKNPFIPKEEFPPLTKNEITKNITNDTRIQAKLRQIVNLSQIVYGNPKILNEKIKIITHNPKLGKQLATQIMSSPNSIAKLAGIEILGMKNLARQKAEQHI
ncbi:MAG: BID domain-containing T4SS effector, partial [Bartonella sp.]|nr:BID domain-containing T4SS effector [Bartonella sp.]